MAARCPTSDDLLTGHVTLIVYSHIPHCTLLQGYEPSVFYPKQSNKALFQNLTKQCQEMEVPFLSFLPDSQLIGDSYNLVVDALFGFSFRPPVRPEFADVLDKLKKVKIPVVSVDIPSGRY